MSRLSPASGLETSFSQDEGAVLFALDGRDILSKIVNIKSPEGHLR
jgi:hypothetical protein